MSKFLFGPSLANRLPRQPNIDLLQRRIRNLLRNYSASAIAECALEMVWQPNLTGVAKLQSQPWLTLLAVKWALEDKNIKLASASPVPLNFIEFIRGALWDHTGAFNKGATNKIAMLRSYMGVQLDYQRHVPWAFARWPALIARRPFNSILRRQFRDVIGMEPLTFLDLTTAIKTALLTTPRGVADTYLDSLAPTYGASIKVFEQVFVRTLEELRSELSSSKKEHAEKELLQFPYFIKFPILRQDRRLLFWDSVVAEKAFEKAIHIRLSSLQKKYSDHFSRVFEHYVVELLEDVGLSPMRDKKFSEISPRSKNNEAVVCLGEANLIVEAKMGLFPDAVLLKDDPRFLFQKLAALRTALEQGWEVSNQLRDPRFGKYAVAQRDYLIVVTSTDLRISGGPMLRELFKPEGDFAYFETASTLPLKNVFIMDIQGFELLCMTVKEGRINLPELLESAAEQNQHVGLGSLFFEQYIPSSQLSKSPPAVIASAIDEALERLTSALETTE